MFVQCGSKTPQATPGSVEEATQIIAAKRAEQAKNAEKLKKKAVKEHLKKQSKSVRKSIKRNAKAQKRRMKYIDYRKVGS